MSYRYVLMLEKEMHRMFAKWLQYQKSKNNLNNYQSENGKKEKLWNTSVQAAIKKNKETLALKISKTY